MLQRFQEALDRPVLLLVHEPMLPHDAGHAFPLRSRLAWYYRIPENVQVGAPKHPKVVETRACCESRKPYIAAVVVPRRRHVSQTSRFFGLPPVVDRGVSVRVEVVVRNAPPVVSPAPPAVVVAVVVDVVAAIVVDIDGVAVVAVRDDSDVAAVACRKKWLMKCS